MLDDLLQKEKVDGVRRLVELKQGVLDFKGKSIPDMEGL